MYYIDLKEKIINLFDKDKLFKNTNEWGFFNEQTKYIKVIAYATNITPEVIQQAAYKKADMLITHHDSWEFVYGLKETCNELLIKSNIIHAYFHAPLDDADFGTNASLAKALKLKDCKKVMPYAENYLSGIIGKVEPPISFTQFTQLLSKILQEPIRQYKNTNKLINKVCIATGGGNMTGEMKIAADENCDTYVTGEYVLYSQQYAHLVEMNLLVGSHTNTEILGVEAMVKNIGENTSITLIPIQEPNY